MEIDTRADLLGDWLAEGKSIEYSEGYPGRGRRAHRMTAYDCNRLLY